MQCEALDVVDDVLLFATSEIDETVEIDGFDVEVFEMFGFERLGFGWRLK